MQLAYVCAPLAGDVRTNIENAREYCRKLTNFGLIPISTHLLFDGVYDDSDPVQREIALDACMEIIDIIRQQRGLLIVFGKEITAGMKREIEAAREYCVPVFNYDTELEGETPRKAALS